ncbi:concanavalin A-like lectin/glucanase domain-containing protein [Tribonema minus]|uniref:Concanavalin A-like lectin/glucanase domain-containing protein n=1 Tax=Tribonema minus TaxID=303371 RepID=A0A836C8Y9_9STRA|nr:concanavalin A-like lectin/glucanase domain-containing protein [Tribonema minus]
MWAYDVGNGCNTDFGCGWGNKELQSYRAANAFLEGGQLVLEAVSEYPVLADGSSFSSGRVHSIAPATVLYGLVEAKITIGSGVGPWGSFFLLPEENVYGDWPGSGEIDVVQMVSTGVPALIALLKY